LTPACAGLLELRGSGLGLLKSALNAENFEMAGDRPRQPAHEIFGMSCRF